MVIRRAAPAHLPLLLPLIARCRSARSQPHDAIAASNGLRPLLQDDRYGVVYLVENGDGIIGYAVVAWTWSLSDGGQRVILSDLFVDGDPAMEGPALEAVVHDLKLRSFTVVVADAVSPDSDAYRLYLNHSFERDQAMRLIRRL